MKGNTMTHTPRFTVCPACEGEGGHDKLGGFTGADMDEWYGDDWGARDEFVSDYRSGVYDEACGTCKGQRVVATADLAEIEQRLADEAELAAEYAAEARYFGSGW